MNKEVLKSLGYDIGAYVWLKNYQEYDNLFMSKIIDIKVGTDGAYLFILEDVPNGWFKPELEIRTLRSNGNISYNVHPTWYSHIGHLFDDPRMIKLQKALSTIDFIPHVSNIFRVFNMPYSNIKVCILGTHPYLNPKYANGLAFAVNEDVEMTKELERIEHEIAVNNVCDPTYVLDKTLLSWEKQGVLLLNCGLTISRNGTSHIPEWKWFIDGVLEALPNHIPLLLWGNYTKIYEYLPNHTFTANHPSYEVKMNLKNTHSNFWNCQHFEKINAILFKLNGLKEELIKW